MFCCAAVDYLWIVSRVMALFYFNFWHQDLRREQMHTASIGVHIVGDGCSYLHQDAASQCRMSFNGIWNRVL